MTEKTDEPQWTEEWIPLSSIIQHGPWQVRVKLDDHAVRRYVEMTRSGKEPPPIKVGLVDGAYYLLDGWHRMKAGALVCERDLDDVERVRVLLARLTKHEAQWESARANLQHGVQYRPKDLHGVFKAFVRAKKHVKRNGDLMSYREIAPHIGKPHTTIRTWMFRYFPATAAKMGGANEGNPQATPAETPNLMEQHKEAAAEAVASVMQRLPLLTPEGRWAVLRQLEEAQKVAESLGVTEPDENDF